MFPSVSEGHYAGWTKSDVPAATADYNSLHPTACARIINLEVKAIAISVKAGGRNSANEFLILTATRSGETLNATWNEFDIDEGVWTIPASRMKTKRPHRVPLSDRALAVLREAKAFKRDGDDFVFPGFREARPLSDMTLSKLTKELGIAAVPHGFRSSFRVWASEQTAHSHQVCEFALAHVESDKAVAAYARSDLFEKRRALMADWDTYLKLI